MLHDVFCETLSSSVWTCWRPLRENLKGTAWDAATGLILKPSRNKVLASKSCISLKKVVRRNFMKPTPLHRGWGELGAADFTSLLLFGPLSQTPWGRMLNGGPHWRTPLRKDAQPLCPAEAYTWRDRSNRKICSSTEPTFIWHLLCTSYRALVPRAKAIPWPKGAHIL